MASDFAPLNQLPFAPGDLPLLIPMAIPAIFGLIVLCVGVFLPQGRAKPLALLNTVGCILAAIAALHFWSGDAEQLAMAGTISISTYAAPLALTILLGTLVIGWAVVHHGLAPDEDIDDPGPTIAHGEFYGLMLFATTGMLGLTIANDLLTLFVALETLSIAVYCLTGIDRLRARSSEGALKYFILGAFSSGFLLMGISFLFGATHTIRLDLMAEATLEARQIPLAMTGAMLILVGMLFKVGAVPFHSWTPDAYEGAPAAVTGFMSVGVKVAAFGAAARLVITLGQAGALTGMGSWILWLVAALTVIVGNAGALTQRNPRRLLAYSAIAHSGYVLIGLVALARVYNPGHPGFGENGPSAALLAVGQDALAGVMLYLLAYGVSNLGAFAVLCHLERNGDDLEDLSDLAGLHRTQPGMALAMTLCLLSLAGIPATAGFLGKLWVFRAGIAVGDIGLVVLALITSALSLYYYLRVVVVMYMVDPGQPIPGDPTHTPTADVRIIPDHRRWLSRLAVIACAVGVILLGVYPTPQLLDLIVAGAQAIL